MSSILPLAAQGTFSSITGVVTDATGAVVPNASVEATLAETGFVYKASSNETGFYTLANLREGTFTLRVQAPGFQEFVASNVLLVAREQRRLDVELKVGTVGTKVEVTAGAGLIETESSRISDVRDRTTINNLPLTLRRTLDLYQLSPQVLKPRNAFYIRFAGSRNKQGDVSIDGASMASVFGGPSTGVTSDRTESYSEFRVDMAGNSAEFAGVGQVSIVTKSGTNDVHGFAFDYYSSPWFQARNPFAVQKDGRVEHSPGGGISGPVFIPKVYDGRNRTFFFFSTEFEGMGSTRQVFNPTVPLPAWREGDFSVGNTIAIKDPYNGGAPFPNNRIPSSRINAAAKQLQDFFYPLPNFGSTSTLVNQNYRENIGYTRPVNPTYVGRFDHRFNDKAFVFWRFTRTDWTQNQFDNALPVVGQREGNRWSRGSSIAWTQTIRPDLLNEFRYGFSSDNIPGKWKLRGLDFVDQLGLQGLAPDLPDVSGWFNVGFVGLGVTGITSQAECNPCANYFRHNFTNNVSLFKGRHSLKAGAFYAWGGYKDYRQGTALFGSHTYTNRYTGFPYSDFLLGAPSTARRDFPAIPQDTRSWDLSFFVSDEFRIKQWLTLTYGVRYEYKNGFTSTNGLQSAFDVATGKVVVPDGALSQVSPLMPRGYVDVIEASDGGYRSDTLIHPDRNNFAPRIAFALRPFGQNTVIRGGFGIFYDLTARNPALSTVPFNVSEPNYQNPTGVPVVVLPVVVPLTGTGGPSTVTLPGAMNPNLRIPYSMQYTFTIEHQRWNHGFRASYTGTNTRQGVWGYDYNSPVADTRLFADKPRAFPTFPSINYFTNGAGHQYHGLALEVEKQMSNGFRYQAHYTWARDIGDLEDGAVSEYAYDRRRERQVWSDIPTHRLSANMSYELPFGPGKPMLTSQGWTKHLFGGWVVNGIFTMDTGFFLTPTWSGPDPTGTRYTPNRTAPVVTLRPDILSDPNLDNPTPQMWFDVGAFAAPRPGAFGTSAGGVIKGPHTNVLHSSLIKTFQIKERVTARFEFIATNATNTPNYLDPNLSITAGVNSGVISNVVNRNQKADSGIPRYMQLVLRILW